MAKTVQGQGPYPAVGSMAPKFCAAASDGTKVRLIDFRGKTVVLYFYPKDDTSGCTKQACGFRDAHEKLMSAGVVVLGVSPDPMAAHRKFIAKHDLSFLLLSDPDHAMCEAYGVWQQKSMYGRQYMGVARTTYIIDPQGRIAHVFEKVKPAGHEQEVLNWLRAHQNAK